MQSEQPGFKNEKEPGISYSPIFSVNCGLWVVWMKRAFHTQEEDPYKILHTVALHFCEIKPGNLTNVFFIFSLFLPIS